MLWVHNYRLNRGILRQTIHLRVEHKGIGSRQPQEHKQNDVHNKQRYVNYQERV